MDEVTATINLVDLPAEGFFEIKGSQLKDLIESLHNCPSLSEGKTGDKFVIKKRSIKSIHVQCMNCDIEAEIPVGSESN